MTIFRIFLLVTLVGLLGACQKQAETASQEATPEMTQLHVYKTPTCGCCADWVSHMEKSGFPLTVENKASLDALKDELNIPSAQRSCHTAVSDNGKYFFEGHIPAHIVKRFLNDPPPDAIGLTVPGMPMGSPGMEVDNRFSPYSVMLIKKNGVVEEFARVETQQSQYQ